MPFSLAFSLKPGPLIRRLYWPQAGTCELHWSSIGCGDELPVTAADSFPVDRKQNVLPSSSARAGLAVAAARPTAEPAAAPAMSSAPRRCRGLGGLDNR